MSTPTTRRRPLTDTAAPVVDGAVREAVTDDRRPIDVTLRLRARSTALFRAVHAVLNGLRPPYSRAEFAARFGASEKDCATVRRWARRHRVTVVRVDPARRAIDLRAPAGRLARLFGVTLAQYRSGQVRWQSAVGSLTLPAELDRIVLGVFGFDNQPLAVRGVAPMATRSAGTRLSFTAPEIARHYRFPARLDGRGQTVGVIALGGGYRRQDLKAFYRALKLPCPRFTNVSVSGARNAPAGPSKMADGEVTGDIETVGALAPAAHIVVYFAPNTERGFLEAVSTAVHDPRYRPQVISVSWGRNEMHWTRRTLRLFNEVLAEAAALGVTVCCASGDYGAFADLQDRKPHVCFPGSSPYVLACGGTSLRQGARRRLVETAWRDAQGASGGGMSALIARPPW
jgi:kumamolisin